MTVFEESGMSFGPFYDSKVFHIENSKLQSRCDNISTVEFIYLYKKNVLMFIEAKSSSPIDRSGNEENYRLFIQEIIKKFEDSLQLFIAGILERKTGHEEISDKIKSADYANMKFRFMLIINGHEDSWLPPLKEDLERNMKRCHNIWNSELFVLNDRLAREQKIIQ